MATVDTRTTADTRTAADAVLREHQELELQTGSLRALLNEDFDWQEIASVLTILAQSVERHFDFEECGGYLRDVLEAVPNAQRDVDRLFAEHQRMREDLHRARHAAVDGSDREQLRSLLGDWLMLLHDHEHRENILAIDVINTDLGGGD